MRNFADCVIDDAKNMLDVRRWWFHDIDVENSFEEIFDVGVQHVLEKE